MQAYNQSRIASWINVIVGIWLIITPYIYGYAGTTVGTSSILIGIVVGVLSLVRAFSSLRGTFWLSWVNVIAGAWLIISPFVLGVTDSNAVFANEIIFGIVVGIVALWNLGVTNVAIHHMAGGTSPHSAM